MTLALTPLRMAVLLTWAAAIACATFGVASDRASLPYRYWSLYVAYLARRLRALFITTPARRIALCQLVAASGVFALGLATQKSAAYLLLILCLLGPAAYIEHLRKRRVRALEAQIDGFTLSLANALKATPSIGNALAYAQPLLAPPMEQEVGLALKEMRLGHSVEQVLLSMAARVRSLPLDAALSSLLVGRQVGGDVPKILEKTASTLREMARLSGVVRAKTAEGKAQLGVLAVFPVLILFLFDTVSRGYFDPLADSAVGWVVIVAAIGLWLASLVMARKVLEVDI